MSDGASLTVGDTTPVKFQSISLSVNEKLKDSNRRDRMTSANCNIKKTQNCLTVNLLYFKILPLTLHSHFFWIRTSKCHCSINSPWIALKLELWALTYVV